MLFSEPSESSERMERSDNPFGVSNTMLYTGLGVLLAGIGAYFYFRKPEGAAAAAPAGSPASVGTGDGSIASSNAAPINVVGTLPSDAPTLSDNELKVRITNLVRPWITKVQGGVPEGILSYDWARNAVKAGARYLGGLTYARSLGASSMPSRSELQAQYKVASDLFGIWNSQGINTTVPRSPEATNTPGANLWGYITNEINKG